MSVEADAPSVRWVYGFKLNIEPKYIQEIRFSCKDIPGTDVVLKGGDPDVSSVILTRGSVVPVSKETTAWLYDTRPTESVCKAYVVSRGRIDMVSQAPVSFSPAAKVLLKELLAAHERNTKLRK